MKCYRCNGSGVDDDNILCYRCGGKGKIELTEQEWLQMATTEQLAEWIVSTNRCKTDHLCAVCRQKWCEKKYVVEWLKQPHHEKE